MTGITLLNPLAMTDKEPILISKEDFACIGQVAKHCDWEQLCIYIREQQNLSLLPKIGQCLYDKLLKYCEGWHVDGKDVLMSVWNGGRYKGCDGNDKVHFGLKRVLVHWAYGAYVLRHGLVDTPFGMVKKLNQDSIPVEDKLLEALNREHRNNASYYYAMTNDFICSMKDCAPLDECYQCGCSCQCGYCKDGGGATLQRRGATFKNISKNV